MDLLTLACACHGQTIRDLIHITTCHDIWNTCVNLNILLSPSEDSPSLYSNKAFWWGLISFSSSWKVQKVSKIYFFLKGSREWIISGSFFTITAFTFWQASEPVSSFHTFQTGSVIIYSHWPLTFSILAWSTPLSLPGTRESQSRKDCCCLIIKCSRRESALRSLSHDAEEDVRGDWYIVYRLRGVHLHSTWNNIHTQKVTIYPFALPVCISQEPSHIVHRHYPQAFFHGGPSASVQT